MGELIGKGRWESIVDWARYRKVASYVGVEKGIPMLDVNEI